MRRFLLKFIIIVGMLLPVTCGTTETLPKEATGTSTATKGVSTASTSPSPETIEAIKAAASETVCFRLLRPNSTSEVPNIGLVSFEWEAATGASAYQLQLELPNGNYEFFNSETESLGKYMESLPLAGTYNWRVLAFESGGSPICFSNRLTFSKTQFELEP